MRGKQTQRITRVRLENWMNFRQVDVPLAQRAFLVGPNASGKSNFLDGIRFLSDLVAVGGGFQEAIRRRGGISRIRSLFARQRPNVTLLVRVGTDEVPGWEYELSFSQTGKKPPMIKRERVVHNSDVLLERPTQPDLEDPQRLTQTFLEQVNVNQSFRFVAEFLRTIRYLHIVPQLVRDPERSVGVRDDPFGGDFLEQVARTSKGTRESRLKKIQQALTTAVPQMKELKLERDAVTGTWHLLGRNEHWRPNAGWQSESQFSDGTLRLLGLLWATLDGEGPLLLEEPELSLHPEVVRFLPQMFARIQRTSRRQIILSTHSPDLLSDEGIGLDEVLLLSPSHDGTTVRAAADYEEIPALLSGGISLGDAVLPKTQPQNVSQLALFPEIG